MERLHLEPQSADVLSAMTGEKGFDIECDQLDAGPFRGHIDFIGTPDVQLFGDQFSRAVCNHGTVPESMAAFTFPVVGDTATFCGELVGPQAIGLITAGDEYSYRAVADHRFFGGCVSSQRLDGALQALHHMRLADVLFRTGALPVPSAAMALMQAATEWPLGLRADDELVLGHDTLDRTVETVVITALCNVLTAGLPPAPSRLASRNHWRCVRTVRSYVDSDIGGDLSTERMCRLAGVSRRTLDTAFLEVTGHSLARFVKIRRLNAARTALAQARRDQTSVKAIALRCGFWHLGRFASDYRAYFGERPSYWLAASERRPCELPGRPSRARNKRSVRGQMG